VNKRIQRQRTKGWRMPEGAVYVGRPSRWGNPFGALGTITTSMTLPFDDPRAVAVGLYRWWLQDGQPDVVGLELTQGSVGGTVWRVGVGVMDVPPRPDLNPLRGRDLACWCPLDQPCHADVLLELANR
jgi:hypothetical protein